MSPLSPTLMSSGKPDRPNFLPEEPRNLTSLSIACLCAALIISAFIVWLRKREKISTFFKYAAFEILLITALFYYST